MPSAAIVDMIVDRLHAHGHAVVPHALASPAVDALRARARALDAAGAFVPAQVGRDVAARQRHERTRGDRIVWLDEAAVAPAEEPVLDIVAALRAACNRALYLGIAEHELHYAIYPPGAGYARHRDRFRDDDARVLSFVLYLNDTWRGSDGGELRLFLAGASSPADAREPDAVPPPGHLDVVPQGGTLVTFLSAAFDHEVLAATRERISLTGWLRRRSQR